MVSYIFGLLVYGLVIMLYIKAPLPLQVVLLIINIFVPDPIPILDELIMGISTCKKINTFCKVYDRVNWCRAHKALTILIIFSVTLALLYIFY